MNYACKLLTPTLKYGEVINVFRSLSESDKQMMKEKNLSFLDWIIDPSVNSLPPSKTQELRDILQSVIKSKLEIGITALGSMKICDIQKSLFRTTDFISSTFLRSVFMSDNSFEITTKNGDDFVKIRPPNSIHSPSKQSDSTPKNTVLHQKAALPTNETSDLADYSYGKPTTAHGKCNEKDCRDKQLRYLYACQPDCIVALQVGATLTQLCKAHNFWESYCTRTHDTFIAWILDMADAMHLLNDPSKFEAYKNTLKKTIAQETFKYVSVKPRSLRELVELINQNQAKFVDANFVNEAIQSNLDILKFDGIPGATCTNNYSLVYTSDKLTLAAAQACDSKEKCEQVQQKVNFSKLNDSETDKDWNLNGMLIDWKAQAKIKAVLTKKASLDAIVCTFRKLASDEKEFAYNVFDRFDCYLNFLIKCFKQFKSESQLEEYVQCLHNHVIKVAKELLESSMSPYILSNLVKDLEASIKLKGFVDEAFLRDSLLSDSDIFQLNNEWVQLVGKNIKKVMKEDSPAISNVTADIKIVPFTEMVHAPQVQELLNEKLCFRKLLRAFQQLPSKMKLSLENLSKSFYTLVLSVADSHKASSEFYKNQVREAVVREVETLFLHAESTSLSILDILFKLCFADFTLIHCSDIRDAVENFSGSCRLVIKGAWVFLKKSDTEREQSPLRIQTQPVSRPDITLCINQFHEDLNFIIHKNETGRSRLCELFHYVREIPGMFMAHIMEVYGTIYGMIIKVFEDTRELRCILQTEILNYLGNKTVFCQQLMDTFFKECPYFTCLTDMYSIIGKKDLFVVVGHNLIGDIVSAVRKPGPDGLPLFFDQFEEHTFFACRQAFPRQAEEISFGKLFYCVWHFPLLTILQRDFIFGAQSVYPFAFHEMHFRRYLLMHPSIFLLQEDIVHCLQFDESQGEVFIPPPDPSSEIKADDFVKQNEVCVVTSPHKKKKKRGRRRKIKNERERSTSIEGSKKQKTHEKIDNKSHKRFKKIMASDKNFQENVSPDSDDSSQVFISTLPDRLLQDVTAGRLLASENLQMEFETVSESLATSLFNDEQRLAMSEKPDFKHAFKLKVSNALKAADQFELSGLLENGFSRSVRLVVQESSKQSSYPSKEFPLVFKSITRLTGVPKQKMINYITRILDINRGSLSIPILCSMISQKYDCKKAIPDTPHDVLHCQAVACLNSNSNFFLNVVRSTCSLTEYKNASEDHQSIQNVLGNLKDEDLNNFIADYLEKSEFSEGLSVDELTAKVASHFSDELASLSVDSVKVLTQSLVADNFRFGFTPLGKVARQRDQALNEDFACKQVQSDDTMEDSSENELQMDVSEDERLASPDSTTKKQPLSVENNTSVESINDLRYDYIEAGVISCNREFTNAVENADSTTFDRLSGFVFSDTKDPQSSAQLRIENPTDLSHAAPFTAMSSSEGCVSSSSQAMANKSQQPRDFKESSTLPAVFIKDRHQERVKLLNDFAIEHFSQHGYSCETHVFVKVAHTKFKEKRFARSTLAFEAYILDFIATSDGDFSFGNCYGDVGVTWIFYKPPRLGRLYQAKSSLAFYELLPKVPDVAYSYLDKVPEKKVHLDLLCEYIAAYFSEELSLLHPQEVLPVCRHLILLSFIRNLKRFMFAKTKPVVYIRAQMEQEVLKDQILTSTSTSTCTSSSESTSTCTSSSEITNVAPTTSNGNYSVVAKSQTAKNTVMALQRVASILRKRGPCTKSKLREYWSEERDLSLQKVFGTGVSFALSLRKFELYFPTSPDGLVQVDENAFYAFLQENS